MNPLSPSLCTYASMYMYMYMYAKNQFLCVVVLPCAYVHMNVHVIGLF